MSDNDHDVALDSRLVRGMHVYDAKGKRIAVVAELDVERDGFFVEEGGFFLVVVPVPMSAVARVNADGVHLTVSKEGADIGNWHDASTDATGAQTRFETETHRDAILRRRAESVGDRDLNIDQPNTVL